MTTTILALVLTLVSLALACAWRRARRDARQARHELLMWRLGR